MIRFIIAGASCAVIEFLAFEIFMNHLKMMYLMANVISIVIAVIVNYMLSRAFVFGKSKYSNFSEITSFIVFAMLALLLNQLILWICVSFMNFDVRISKVLAICIVTMHNYFTKKYIIFKSS